LCKGSCDVSYTIDDLPFGKVSVTWRVAVGKRRNDAAIAPETLGVISRSRCDELSNHAPVHDLLSFSAELHELTEVGKSMGADLGQLDKQIVLSKTTLICKSSIWHFRPGLMSDLSP